MNKNILDYLYCLVNGLREDVMNFFADFHKYLKRKFKTNNHPKKEYLNNSKKKIRLKRNALKEIYIIFILAFLGALVITINSFVNGFISINDNKVKEIKMINYLKEDTAKEMIIDDREGIELVVDILNKIKKKTKENDLSYDDVFSEYLEEDIKEKNDDELSMIIIIEYKKKTDIINVYNDKITYKKKTIEFHNTLNVLWYTLNYKIISISYDDYKNYIINK